MKGVRLSVIVSAAALLLALPTMAWAQRGTDPVLSLGVQSSGKYDAKLSAMLRDSLAKGGELLVQDARVTAPERLCTNAECMTQLGSREGAKLVVSTQLRPSGPNSQYLTTVVFDVARRVPHDEHGLCDRCSPDLLSRTIAELAERSLRNYRERVSVLGAPTAPTPLTAPPSAAPAAPGTSEPPLPTAAPATPAAPTPAVTPSEPAASSEDFWSRMPKNRKIIAGVLGGALLLALVPTVALHATDGQETGLACAKAPCVLHNQPLYIGGYALSGALAVGLTLTILWPTGKGSATTTASAVEVK
jgi:hypothetical protein